MSLFGNLEQEIVGFFTHHGQSHVLDAAKKVVIEIEDEVKAIIGKAETDVSKLLPVVETYLLKYEADASKVKDFIVPLAEKFSGDIPTFYQKVAEFAVSKLSGTSVLHFLRLAIEYVYSFFVKSAPPPAA